MAINTSNAPSLLLPYLHEVIVDYQRWPDSYKEVYTTFKSHQYAEFETENSTLGPASYKQDGQPVSMQTMGEQFKTTYFHDYYGTGFMMTRGAVLDNQYPEKWPRQLIGIRDAIKESSNINAMQIFNNAFNSGSTLADGQPLCSTAHPTLNGTLANTFINGVQFSEQAVEDAIIIMKGWTTFAGNRMNVNVVKALVPPNLNFQSIRILHGKDRTGTANREINAIVHSGAVSDGFVVSPYLIYPKNWFLLTDHPNSLKHFLREPIDIDAINDMVADIITTRGIIRESFGCSNFRGVFGAQA